MTITLQAVNELIQSLESAGELSIKERKYLDLAKAYQQLAAENVAPRQRIAELEDAEQKLCAANVTLDARAELAERQMAELESRTVKLPELFKLAKSSSGLTYYYADEVNAALNAAGIKVEAE
ncbi:hypothetical protein [Raoultella planticola]|uniref:hypothetical protein n=1 Tax=Raoultella planticola TaxID=575 RepID=UPI001CCF8502|nr:hypothetical protein [Raoultella planticola]MBZ7829923.1 hypothetical protein [Raoultella planticola]